MNNPSPKISVRAVSFGWLIANAGQLVFTGVIVPLAVATYVWLYSLGSAQVPGKMEEWAKRWSDSTASQLIDTVATLLPLLVGGYVAARIAGIRPVTHSFVVGVLSVLTTMLLAQVVSSLGWSEFERSWRDFAHWLLYVPVAVVGGYVRSLATGRPL